MPLLCGLLYPPHLVYEHEELAEVRQLFRRSRSARLEDVMAFAAAACAFSTFDGNLDLDQEAVRDNRHL